jgi:hypothetical protein
MPNFRLSDDYLQEINSCRRNDKEIRTQDIFFPFPAPMGLRGDPYLWSALAAYFMDDIKIEADFPASFRDAFQHLTGHDFDRAPEMFQVDNFSHGGMSSGGISMTWWRETGYPLLCARYDELKRLVSAYLEDD